MNKDSNVKIAEDLGIFFEKILSKSFSLGCNRRPPGDSDWQLFKIKDKSREHNTKFNLPTYH